MKVRWEARLRLERLAGAAYPLECAGILVGRGRCIEGLIPAPNGGPGAFTLEPSFLAEAFRDVHAEGREIIGVYHSHPGGSCRPSGRDHRELPPFCLCLIVAAGSECPPEMGGYIRDSLGQPLEEVTLEITSEPAGGRVV